MNVRDIMRTDVVTAHPDQTVRELTRVLAEHGISGVPVVTDSGEVLGVVSASDVIQVAVSVDQRVERILAPAPDGLHHPAAALRAAGIESEQARVGLEQHAV